jgi:hypothetical protein
MSGQRQEQAVPAEQMDPNPAVDVSELEYRRLLGYPPGHVPGERARELAAWARRRYAEIGRPWIYSRGTEVRRADGMLFLGGQEFRSRRLLELFDEWGASGAVLVAVSAGRGCEEHARRLWSESKPDEYFFLEVFGSAVVERLVSLANARICGDAEQRGLVAMPHYSPGYTGWDVADQGKLLDLLGRGLGLRFPEPIEVMPSGMLVPKKAMLAVVGLDDRGADTARPRRLTPCQACSFSPCQFRRAPYVYSAADKPQARMDDAAPITMSTGPALRRGARYRVNTRALRKWAGERVRLSRAEDGSVEACFRFDGTTCSNLGRPLAFDYRLSLGTPEEGYRILDAECGPAPGDTGHTFMCAYINDPAALMAAIGSDKPPLGRPLDEAVAWAPAIVPNGCHCDAGGRAHKWVLALEAVHYALAHAEQGTPVLPD